MLEKLTAKQEALMSKVAREYIALLTKPKPYNRKTVNTWLDVVYRLYDMKRPQRVEVAQSPVAALRLASDLTGTKQTQLDWCGICDAGWVAFYDYFERIGVTTREENADVRALRGFLSMAWDSVLLDECAIVVARPTLLLVDDDGNLHSTSGPCIEWGDGERDFAYHGTWIDERMVRDPRGYSREEYLAITNTEQRRALSEIAGWDWVISLLGGTTMDRWTDPRTKLAYELIQAGEQRLLKKQSPELANGSQPTYIEPVHETLRTAAGARKWQATRLTPEACDADPALVYGVET
jgi:hypothetical protein